MFKPLIAVFFSLILLLGGMGKPAYASSGVLPLMNFEGGKTGVVLEVGSPALEEFLTNSLVKKSVESAVTFGTVVVICFTANTVATTVFPPAAVILPYCPAVGGFALKEAPINGFVKEIFKFAH
ncbi:hypothetical protein QUA41_27645 [Microcoleus sp. Pol11C1]|uniref:hypothetical protein n=1 Tax=unclassified Microcoleus TaxID=2642155 RepID=UPI002FD6BAE6